MKGNILNILSMEINKNRFSVEKVTKLNNIQIKMSSLY